MQGSKDKEVTALMHLVSTTEATLYGLTRANYKSLMPYIHTRTAAETFDESFVQKMIDTVAMYSNIQPNIVSCAGTTYYTIMNLLAGYVKNVDMMNMAGGIVSASFSGIPLIRNRFININNLFVLNSDQFVLHQLFDWEWLTHSDGSILKQKEGYATYSATLVKYADLMCNRPNAQGMISISEGKMIS